VAPATIFSPAGIPVRKPHSEHLPLVDRIIKHLTRSKNTLAVGHVNADPDAIGAAVALAEAFPNVTVGAFDGLNKSAQRLADALGVTVVINPNVEEFETVVVCDATSASQLKATDPALYSEAIFMDHHQPSNFANSPFYWSDSRYKATCEMAVALIRRAGHPLTQRAQVALLAGIITDTGRFKFNDEEVFHTVLAILFPEQGPHARPGLYQYVRALVEEGERDPSEVTAQLKGLGRTQFERVGDWFMAWTTVSAFESNCSVLLLSAGADVSVAFSERGTVLRGSARANAAAVEAGVNLGALFRDFAPDVRGVKWDGGGHAGAAGFSGERTEVTSEHHSSESNLSPWADALRREVVSAIAQRVSALPPPKAASSAPPWDAGAPPAPTSPAPMG
jgi:bifunctional oligoribonuclease and PAP phosphatase NrnA